MRSSYASRVAALTDQLRQVYTWLPPYICAWYAVQFIANGAGE